MLVATTMPVAADPGRPVSNKTSDGGGTSTGPTHKVALGMATPDGRSPQEVDAFTAAVGKKPAIWAIWSQWGNASNREFPTTMANELKARNIQPVIWWEPVDPTDLSDPTYPRHQNIIDGHHDAYIRAWAQDAKAYGGNVLLRFAHEMNNNYFPWSINFFDNSPTSFIAAWRRVHDIIRSEGATNVKFVWSVNKQVCSGGCNPYHEIYPGHAYVDIMAFTGYNWGAIEGKQWNTMLDSYRMVTRKLGEVSSKPIMVAETASNHVGGDKAAWIREGYRQVYQELPSIKAIVWLNADLRDMGHPDWRISTPAEALVAYAEIAALPQFDTRSPFRKGQRAAVKARQDARDRAEKRARKAAKAEADESRRKQPRVREGKAVNTEPRDADDGAARKGTNVTTKPPKKKKKKPADEEPPEVLDTFSR